MTSILKVSEIQDPTNSNTALSIDATGKVTAGNLTSPGHMVQVQNADGNTPTTIANSGSGRIYADLLTISYTPISSSNKLVLLGTAGFGANASESAYGAFGIIFDVNGTDHDFGNYPWYDTSLVYPIYPPDTTISKTIAVPTGSAFNIKLKGYSYNESVGTMTPQFIKYALTVMEIAQ